MPRNYYTGKTEAELLVIRDQLQSQQDAGMIVGAATTGVSQSRTLQGVLPIATRLDRVEYSLFLLAPSTYSNPYLQRITRTRARYTFS